MKTCSFFGHRNTKSTPELCENLRKTIIYLITEKGVNRFLFGSKSNFDDLSLEIVTELKKDYSNIKRVYVRSQYANIQKSYQEYLLKFYDETIIANNVENAGKASYVKRNQEMINESDYCVFYYNERYKPPLKKRCKGYLSDYQPNSGTAIAFQYAKSKKKQIINLCESKKD